MAANIKQRIQDFCGSDMDASVVVSYEDIIKSAFNFIIDLIPSTSVLWSNTVLPEDTVVNSTTEFENKRILSVKRKDSANAIYYPCKEISLADGLITSDPDTIHYNAKGSRTPTYYVNELSQLVVLPSATASEPALVYYVNYLLPTTSDISSFTSMLTNQSTQGIPELVIDLGCLRASILLLQARVSDAVQDEEDTELLQLLQVQLNSLNNLFREEPQRLNIPFKKVGISDDIA